MPEIKTPLHPISPLPIGTKVDYHGSQIGYHGIYGIYGVYDAATLEQSGRDIEHYAIDRVGYALFPWGLEQDWRNRERALHYVRRESFTVIDPNEPETVELTTPSVVDTLRTFLDEPEFIYVVGSANIPHFEAVFDLAEQSLIREAESGT